MSIVVKYHNQRMLLTLDLNALVEVIMRKYGDETVIEFAPMTAQERAETMDDSSVMNAVRERFWIFEVGADQALQRMSELETAAVATGVK